MSCQHDRSDKGNCPCKEQSEYKVTISLMVDVKVKGKATCPQALKDLCRKPLEEVITNMTCQDITPLDAKVEYVNMESAQIAGYDE